MSNPKEIQEQIHELHVEIENAFKLPGTSFIAPRVLQKHAMIVDLTSQLAENASGRLERQTNRLIRLTWALVGLTAALLILTASLLILTFVLVKHG